jgi:hypothetical protein
MSDTILLFAKAKYLIFSSWETRLPSGGTVGGSNYYNVYPNNESEAIEMLEKVKKNAVEFNAQYPYLNTNTKRKYGYHLNNLDWWNVRKFEK